MYNNIGPYDELYNFLTSCDKDGTITVDQLIEGIRTAADNQLIFRNFIFYVGNNKCVKKLLKNKNTRKAVVELLVDRLNSCEINSEVLWEVICAIDESNIATTSLVMKLLDKYVARKMVLNPNCYNRYTYYSSEPLYEELVSNDAITKQNVVTLLKKLREA